jgi:hypothetical protein
MTPLTQNIFPKGLEAAASAQLVPDSDLAGLKAKLHVARVGQMATYGTICSPVQNLKSGGNGRSASVPIYFGKKVVA